MSAAIVYETYHHGNTKRVAEAMAEAIGADLVHLRQRPKADLREYAVVGIGSGIYHSKHAETIIAFVGRARFRPGARVFVFSTAGVPFLPSIWHRALKNQLQGRGVPVSGELCLPGHDSYAIFGMIGGINRGRPNDDDLERARAFARTMAEG
jgi:flavodoxin